MRLFMASLTKFCLQNQKCYFGHVHRSFTPALFLSSARQSRAIILNRDQVLSMYMSKRYDYQTNKENTQRPLLFMLQRKGKWDLGVTGRTCPSPPTLALGRFLFYLFFRNPYFACSQVLLLGSPVSELVLFLLYDLSFPCGYFWSAISSFTLL